MGIHALTAAAWERVTRRGHPLYRAARLILELLDFGDQPRPRLTSKKRTIALDTKDFEQEFAYTTWEQSCKDPAVIQGDLRECRRPKGHKSVHASGHGKDLLMWGTKS